jgi:hypothetical protein
LPVDLASVVGSIAAGAGCAGDGGAGAPPEEVCGLLGSAASTAGTLQQTAEAQTGQALPADLEAVVADVAARAGCGADEPAGSGGSDSPDGPGGGSDGGAQASAGASAGGASVDASISVDELPRTGGPAAVPAVGGGLLALGGVAELLRRRLAR